MEKITGSVKNITFRNEENGFTIFRFESDSQKTPIVCLGTLPSIKKGENLEIRGQWATDPKYGRQLKIQDYHTIIPSSEENILKFLKSGVIKGIGPSKAKDLVKKFGIDTLKIIDKSPEKLLKIKGIGANTLLTIKKSWKKGKEVKNLVDFLKDYDLTLSLINKIYSTYGSRSESIIASNPYKLSEDIFGIGFKKADIIARKAGLKPESYKRIKAGIFYALSEAANQGHVYLPKTELLQESRRILQISEPHIIQSLDHLLNEKILIPENGKIYLPHFYKAEKAVAENISRRLKINSHHSKIDDIDQWIDSYSKKYHWKGDKFQIKAVRNANSNSIMILTGGPGTGKTTTLKVIVRLMQEQNHKILLAAPTGRAANRLTESTKLRASTIHRLLEYNPRDKKNPFQKNSKNTLECDVLICDEISMIDLPLMSYLLDALSENSSVIFVGDSDQLPSVGAGNVLSDLIKTSIVPHINLEKVFRQAAESRIVTAAHEIKSNRTPQLLNSKEDNLFLLQETIPENSLQKIINLICERLPQKRDLNPIKDIQVLSPMHKGILGTESLNFHIQEKLNPQCRLLKRGNCEFRLHDKVMQVRNNYDNNIFNGDIGFICRVEEDSLTVDFKSFKVEYDQSNLDELTLAYCITIHKSQGSEFNTVILPVSTQHFVMLKKNLIYTALTRAKELCIMVGDKKALSLAVKSNDVEKRFSNLSSLIKQQIH